MWAGGGPTTAARTREPYVWLLVGYGDVLHLSRACTEISAGPPGIETPGPGLRGPRLGASNADMSLSGPWTQHRQPIRLGTLTRTVVSRPAGDVDQHLLPPAEWSP